MSPQRAVMDRPGLSGHLFADTGDAGYALESAGVDERGAIFTRCEVVEFILDLVGYRPDRPLARSRLLEPSAGHGDFLLPAVTRLVRSFVDHGGDLLEAEDALGQAVLAFEIDRPSLATAREAVASELVKLGVGKGAAVAARRGADRYTQPHDTSSSIEHEPILE